MPAPAQHGDSLDRSTGRRVIAAIGIDRYWHWDPLHNAVRDATGTVALFVRLGFQEIAPPLLDDQATGHAIRSLVSEQLMTLGPEDSLVLFYAGHGATRDYRLDDRVVKMGYLIPVDAKAPDKVATWIDLRTWLQHISLLPAKHILVILDSCHSGIALDPVIRWRDIASWRNKPLSILHKRRSRRIITSALGDQIVRDGGPLADHSLFTGCLIEGLTDGIRPRNHPMITGSELALYVRDRVASYPDSQQTPDFGAFDHDNRGEIHIPLAAAAEPVEPVEPAADGGGTTQLHSLPENATDRHIDDRPGPASTIYNAARTRAGLICAATIVTLTSWRFMHYLSTSAPAPVERPCTTTIRSEMKEISSDTTITNDVVCFDSAFITIHGTHSLVIKATSVRVLRTSSIAGEGDPGSAGAAGHHAYQGTQDGCHQGNLMSDAEGRTSWCTEVLNDWSAANEGCSSSVPPEPCEIGGTGGKGRAGAAGPSVIFDVLEPPRLSGLDVQLVAGRGGPGGAGGLGVRHYWVPTCPSDYHDLHPSAGPRLRMFDCPSGTSGARGPPGPPGQCVVRLRGQERPCDEFKQSPSASGR